jgi:type VI secretion system protein ImpG
MTEDLSRYYESELTFIRQLAGEFAQKHRKIAARLQLRDENKESGDPHVERLIEAFALLTARIRNKIDDEFPEIVESLLQLLYPHYLRPIPPMAIAQFQFDPGQTRLSSAAEIPAGSVLHSKAVQGTSATFRTAYPVTLWPIQIKNLSLVTVSSANLPASPSDASHVLRIQLSTVADLPTKELGVIPSLRFFLAGDGAPSHTLYELLMEHSQWVQLRSVPGNASSTVLHLPGDCIQPVGFDTSQALLPYSQRSFPGYRLLQEYFHFPEKFFFFDVMGLDTVDLGTLTSTFELDIFFRDSELRERIPAAAQATRGEALQLGCTPIVNLFERLAEPIRVSHLVSEYPVVPDRHRQAATEVYSIDRVTSTASYAEEPKVYEPFYSLRHTYGEHEDDRCFWHESRRASMRPGDNGTEVDLSLVDLNFDPKLPASEVLSVHVTCTNRDFISQLRWQREWGDLSGEGLPLVQARCTTPPSPARRPPLRGGLQWRLISHLTLNHLSLIHTNAEGNPEALREILGLYCFDDQEDARQRIGGLISVGGKPSVSRVVFESGVAFCRGLDVEIELDEDRFSGSGAYLLASVLERFLASYGTMNSYTRLTARSKQRRQPMARWQPRAGDKRLA